MEQAPDRTPETVQIALAEFQAIRSEIEQKFRAHDALMSLNFTLNVGLVGLVLGDKAPIELLVLVPLLSAALTTLWRRQLWTAAILGSYIRDVLQPMLAELVADGRVLRFEHYYFAEFLGRRAWFVHPVADRMLMPLASAVVLALTSEHMRGALEWSAWLIGGLLTLLQLAEGVRSILRLRTTRRRALERRLTPAERILRHK